MKLLIDNITSYRIAHALHALFEPDHEIVALRERFPAGTPDIDWIGELHRQGAWAVLTRDLGIRTRPHERAAMDASRIVFFFMSGAWRNSDCAETAVRLIRLVPIMAAQVELGDRGRFELPFKPGAKLRPYRD